MRAVTIEDFLGRLKKSRVRRGEIRPIKLGRQVRLRAEDVEKPLRKGHPARRKA